MSNIRTYIGRVLTLTVWTSSLGVLLFASIPQAEADPWWYPISMRNTQYSANRHIAALPIAAASGIAATSGVFGISAVTGASAVADTMAASAVDAASSVAVP